MSDSDNNLENIWSALLSRDPQLVRTAYDSLNAVERESIHAHLLRMAHEPGWQDEQRISAQTALEILSENPKQV